MKLQDLWPVIYYSCYHEFIIKCHAILRLHQQKFRIYFDIASISMFVGASSVNTSPVQIGTFKKLDSYIYYEL